MRRGRVVVMATALVALVAATGALAAPTSSVRLSGHATGDDESIVRLSVTSNDVMAKSVKRFRFKKVVATCDGVVQRISLKTTGRVPVDPDERTFKRSFTDSIGGLVRVEGRVSRNGLRVVGAFNAKSIVVDGLGTTCKVATQGFAAHS